MEYLIKWCGYSSEFNSWEPRENLSETLIAALRKLDEESTDQSGSDQDISVPLEESHEELLEAKHKEQLEEPDEELLEELQTSNDDNDDKTYRYGFERGLEPEKILGTSILLSIMSHR